MPPVKGPVWGPGEPIPAFLMYKKTANKQIIKKKKKKTTLLKNNQKRKITTKEKASESSERGSSFINMKTVEDNDLEGNDSERGPSLVSIKTFENCNFQGINQPKNDTKKPKSVRFKKTVKKSKASDDSENAPTLVQIQTVEDSDFPCKSDVKKNKSVEKSSKKLARKPPQKPSDDPTMEAFHLFRWLISPLKPSDFLNKHWEQKVLHIERSNRNYYSHILDSRSLDTMLRNHTLYYTRNIDVVSYENGVKEVHNQEGRAMPSAVWDYYSNGCSIRILNPQTYNHKVHLLVSTLQEYFGSMVGANVYLTPPGSQGFAPHYDDIEAFVIQLEGRKHWKLYEPNGADVLARYSSHNFKREELGDPFMEVALEAGEVLYFPRGTIHEGRTDEESHSLHITVSVYQQNSYADLLGHILPKALEKAAQNDIEYRKGLPLNYLKKFGAVAYSHDRETVTSNVAKLIESLVEYIDIDGAADQLGRRLMRDSMPPVLSKSETERSVKADGAHLDDGQVIDRVEIGLDTRVRLLRYYCLRLVNEEGSSPKLYYNTENANVYHGEEEQWLELDASMIPVINVLQNIYPNYVSVDELPMEDIAVKIQLISDLWEHGLLVTEEPLDVIDD